MGRPRTLPDPEPRFCEGCGQHFTPARKKWRAKLCSRACQWRYANSLKRDNATLSRDTADKRGDVLRGRGAGKTRYVKRGGKHEHVLVAERKIGRLVLPGEVVHHVDRNPRNNDPSNLEVIRSQSDHIEEHRAELLAGRRKKGGLGGAN